jgi:hypothetical protein
MDQFIDDILKYNQNRQVARGQALIGSVLLMLAFAAFFALQLWLAKRGRAEVDQKTGRKTWRRGPFLRWTGYLMCFGLPAFIGATLLKWPNMTQESIFAMIGLSAFTVLLGIWLIVEGTRFRVSTDESGLECQPGWGAKSTILWTEIAEVYPESMHASLTIKTLSGTLFRVPLMLPGIPEFLEQMESRLPHQVIEKIEPIIKNFKKD